MVLKGRCPSSYGENIDYWPILQAVRQATGIRGDDAPETAMSRLLSLTQGNEIVAVRLGQMLGIQQGTGSPETTSAALGRLIEMLAASQPVVLVIDDLHWAKPTLLDLLAQVAERSGECPRCWCMARRSSVEFRLDRPEWSSAMSDVTSLTLRKLDGHRTGSSWPPAQGRSARHRPA
jgi:predicted ATPase